MSLGLGCFSENTPPQIHLDKTKTTSSFRVFLGLFTIFRSSEPFGACWVAWAAVCRAAPSARRCWPHSRRQPRQPSLPRQRNAGAKWEGKPPWRRWGLRRLKRRYLDDGPWMDLGMIFPFGGEKTRGWSHAHEVQGVVESYINLVVVFCFETSDDFKQQLVHQQNEPWSHELFDRVLLWM